MAAGGWDDTIVALATPPGVGAIAVIRLSGPRSFEIINHLFPSKDLLQQQSHTIHVGFLKRPMNALRGENISRANPASDVALDEVVLSLFRGPRSYTGEDVIEISCHGSPYVQQQIIDACMEAGARLAKPGEFTQRAFLNGKLDLAQAEAVADLISSNSKASHKAALHTMRGGFSGRLHSLRERLIRFSALIELELDFSQEDVEFADRSQFYALLKEMQEATSQLSSSFRLGNVIKNGVNVAIIGKPNAGKSTLLNALLQEERAIVSDIAGTTRDTIEEVLNIDGLLFRLIDTAGIRDHTGDAIESAGIERSFEKMRQADIVLYLFDANDAVSEVSHLRNEIEKHQSNYLLVVNKIDQIGEEVAVSKFAKQDKIVFIAAKSNRHIDVLKERMVDLVLQGRLDTENTIVTNARHYHALKEVEKSLAEIMTGLDNGLPGDLLALDIRRCLSYLGEITGEVNNEEMLDYIFSKFCIGK